MNGFNRQTGEVVDRAATPVWRVEELGLLALGRDQLWTYGEGVNQHSQVAEQNDQDDPECLVRTGLGVRLVRALRSVNDAPNPQAEAREHEQNNQEYQTADGGTT